MIEKIKYIKNCGKFTDFQSSNAPGEWDGTFRRVNTIFALNGLGKTTIAQIFTSLRGNYSRIKHKRNIFHSGNIDISLVVDGDEMHYDYFWRDSADNQYKPIPNIDVFDHYYSDNFLNVNINIPLYNAVFKNTEVLWEKYDVLAYELKDKINRSKSIKTELNKYVSITPEDQLDINHKSELEVAIHKIQSEINKLDFEMEKECESINSQINQTPLCAKYVSSINTYLSNFSTNFRIEKLCLSSGRSKCIDFVATLNGKKLDDTIVKHAPSEGDKTALSLAFFLAYIDILPDSEVEKRIIVFDDPFTSFDDNRKNATITSLLNLKNKCQQLFLLSHDLSFVKKFSDNIKNKNSLLNLKIYNNKVKSSSSICIHNISEDSMSGIVKDYMNLKQYSDGLDVDPINVANSIRTVIEGFLRIKFYDVVQSIEGVPMVGVIIEAIERSHLLKGEIINELRALKDYSNGFHHPDISGNLVNETELDNYVKRTLEVLPKIFSS